MLRTVIVDDEHFAREIISEYLKKIEYVELVASLNNPLELEKVIEENHVDLLFLDIQMPQIKGTKLLEKMSKPPVTIFTTAYTEYALEAFDLHVVDYLVKPFSFERFTESINKAKKFVSASKTTALKDDNTFFTFRADRIIHKILKEEIVLVESQLEYVKLYTKDERFMFVESLKNLEAILPEPNFLRVHNSYIIGVKYATKLEGSMLKVLDKEVPVSRSRKKKVQQQLFNFK